MDSIYLTIHRPNTTNQLQLVDHEYKNSQAVGFFYPHLYPSISILSTHKIIPTFTGGGERGVLTAGFMWSPILILKYIIYNIIITIYNNEKYIRWWKDPEIRTK